MRILIFALLLSSAATAFAVLSLISTDWLLLAAPCAMASALLILARLLKRKPRSWAVVDGSNVMHWKDGEPRIETVREVVERLTGAGLTPDVVFDANVGYKIKGRYLHHNALADLLNLPEDRVMVAPSGTPADPLVLQVAKDYGAIVVSNDRFRDWAEEFGAVLQPEYSVRGGYRDGALWLSL